MTLNAATCGLLCPQDAHASIAERAVDTTTTASPMCAWDAHDSSAERQWTSTTASHIDDSTRDPCERTRLIGLMVTSNCKPLEHISITHTSTCIHWKYEFCSCLIWHCMHLSRSLIMHCTHQRQHMRCESIELNHQKHYLCSTTIKHDR